MNNSTDSDLKSLTLKRGHLKGQLTRFTNFLANFSDQSEIMELESRLERVEPLFGEFNQLQMQIENLSENEAVSEAVSKAQVDFESAFFESVGQAKKIISTYYVKQQHAHPQTSGIVPISTHDVYSISGKTSVNLPPMNLPKFNGDYDKWYRFAETFKSMVHNNNKLDNSQKYYYLLDCLQGDAAEVLDSLEETEDKYSEAWELLKERFENKPVIIQTHLKAIVDMPALKQESAVLLRKFLDSFRRHFRVLRALGEPIESWDRILILILSRKLDTSTKQIWEDYSIEKCKSLPKITDFTTFLANRCQALSSVAEANSKQTKSSGFRKEEKTTSHASTQNYLKCEFCKGSHHIYHCKQFLSLPVAARLEKIKEYKLCINCLRPNHFLNACKADGCRKCKRRHNTLLHFDKPLQNSAIPESESDKEAAAGIQSAHCVVKERASVSYQDGEESVNLYSLQTKRQSQIILPTAIVHIADIDGKVHNARCLLDSGSQSSFLSSNLSKKLRLPLTRIHLPVLGVGQVSTNIKFKTKGTIKSRYNNFKVTVDLLVLDKITSNIPTASFDISSISIPPNKTLADPDFNIGSSIDMLLGASVFFDIFCAGQIKLGNGMLTLQKSMFGWVVAGPVALCESKMAKVSRCHLSVNQSVQEQLERFWKIEECDAVKSMPREYIECEQDFINSVARDETGRFIVNLPIREGVGELGDSLEIAKKRFFSTERKLSRNPVLKEKYCEFMREYMDMGHMSKIEATDKNSDNSFQRIFYLPHHGVVNESSITTKLRIVFDGSAKTTSGLSLNDLLKIGPTIQDDLFTILIRFRQHNVVVTSDIAKMYRMINVTESQRDLQRIVWRFSTEEDLGHYRLNTVTYGTGPASYLATRCLKQVSDDVKSSFPSISKIIAQDFYMDDLLTGADSVEGAIKITREISDILSQYGFILRKWSSNDREVLNSLADDRGKELGYFITDNETKKTLGVFWNSSSDELEYLVNISSPSARVTKRNILSVISRIFDPLGLVGPVIIRAKIILQRLWVLRLGWDEAIPLELFTIWSEFQRQLPLLNKIRIARQATIKNCVKLEIHAFCDASQKASGTCIYLRTQDCNGKVNVILLCSKSRVAPIKTISIPRLELCGALLAAKLANRVASALEFKSAETFYWTDSTIVLAWLSEQPSVWKTFVSNRVSEIQQLTLGKRWGHVPSNQNPADIISRGLNPGELGSLNVWWHGPQFLLRDRKDWPNDFNLNLNEVPEKRKTVTALVNVQVDMSIFTRFSSLYKLQRIVALCLRFHKNLTVNKTSKLVGRLSVEELNEAMIKLVKVIQVNEYSHEWDALNNSRAVPTNSKIKSLDPFLDESKVIRVGGRLKNSGMRYDSKFPIILPPTHPLTRLIIQSEHLKQLHAGPQAILAKVRQTFWITNGRRAVRSVLSKCVTCFRARPTDWQQKMGDLPSHRVMRNRPFSICGTDFAGPFNLKDGKIRNRAIVKAYLCIFICFSTKAVHLELVGDLSTEAFLNAFKRFVSRRGLCSHIYSDNGTNYVGANNELKRVCEFFAQVGKENSVANFCAQNSIKWHFIAPRSPHQGGLWESMVKAAKYHVTRIVGNNNLTFEELTTVFAQIEAVLNSRPLVALSNDPNDLVPLTPGHFLIGSPLNAVPQANLMEVPENRLSRYQLLQRMTQHFWSRWSREYLSSLQQRSKWHQPSSSSPEVGSLVVLKDENSPPLNWRMGRIIKLYPGSDKLVRVVEIQTSNGVVKRAVQKICPLPIFDSNDIT